MSKSAPKRQVLTGIGKCPTGIRGLDEIMCGGLPQGRPTLVCGNAGSGKTILAMEFLVRGATEHGEPGVFVAFEELAGELTNNVRSLNFDLEHLKKQGQLIVDSVQIERSEIEETGAYDLSGLFIRLGHAIDSIGARRVALDSIEALFAGFSDTGVIRAELHRLFRWLKEKGVTSVVTGERGEGTLTRHGIEEYVSDCVIALDHRIADEMATRRLRIVKYRGSSHGTNEYPFLVGENGIEVLPITSAGLTHRVSIERISTGIADLDAMLGGKGFYRGSSVLVSGSAGSGKTSIAAHLAMAACQRRERCLYFPFEESPEQIIRNMRCIGLDLEPMARKELLQFKAARPSACGLETHLAVIHKYVREFDPRLVVFDPISSLSTCGSVADLKTMITRLVDFLKTRQITAVFLNLTKGAGVQEDTDVGISSIIDTWVVLRDIELNGERNRALHILKSRGMAHSNQVREFLLTDNGIRLSPPYVGPEGMLTGSARLSQEARELAAVERRRQEVDRLQRGLKRRQRALQARIDAQRFEFEQEEEETKQMIAEAVQSERILQQDRADMARNRKMLPAHAATHAGTNGRERKHHETN